MATDLSKYKVPVFPNINDVPIVPVASKAGNGADLIVRLNGLIDELTTLLNTVVGSSISWTVKLPSSSNYAELEIYHRNMPERQIYKALVSTANLTVTQEDLASSYRLSTSIGAGEVVDPSKIINPNDTIDISEIINLYGVGYYFFVFRNSDKSIRDNTSAMIRNATIRGAITYLYELIYLSAFNDRHNSSTVVTVMPLVVNQVIGQVEIELVTEIPEIG